MNARTPPKKKKSPRPAPRAFIYAREGGYRGMGYIYDLYIYIYDNIYI